jgi:hypothetical protein
MDTNDRAHVGARIPRELYQDAAVRMVVDRLGWQQLIEAAITAYVDSEWTPKD